MLALAGVYIDTGKPAEAEPLLTRSLSIQGENQVDPKAPDSVTYRALTTASLARCYTNQGRFPEAEPLFQKSVAMFETAGLNAHPDLAKCLEPYAALLRKTGREAEAAALESRAHGLRTGAGLP